MDLLPDTAEDLREKVASMIQSWQFGQDYPTELNFLCGIAATMVRGIPVTQAMVVYTETLVASLAEHLQLETGGCLGRLPKLLARARTLAQEEVTCELVSSWQPPPFS